MVTVNTYAEEQLKNAVLNNLGRIAPEADLGQLAPTDDIRETLDIDSFDFLNFLIALNDDVGVEIPESDYGQVNTLGGLLDYLEARIG